MTKVLGRPTDTVSGSGEYAGKPPAVYPLNMHRHGYPTESTEYS